MSKIDELRQCLQEMTAKGISQEYIAEKAGVQPSAVSRLLSNSSQSNEDSAIRLWEFATGNARLSAQPQGHERLATRSELDHLVSTSAQKSLSSSFFRFTVVERNVVKLSGELFVRWLPVSVEPIRCKAVVTPEGGRRLIPLSGATTRKISELEKSSEDSPATVNEFGTDRIRLDRYWAAAWDVQVMRIDSGNFAFHITMPDDVIPAGTKVLAYARLPEILELTGLPEDLTELMAELKRIAVDFPALLDRLSRM